MHAAAEREIQIRTATVAGPARNKRSRRAQEMLPAAGAFAIRQHLFCISRRDPEKTSFFL